MMLSRSPTARFNERVRAAGLSVQARRDQVMMRHALTLAQQAADQGEVPVGAVIVHRRQIIATGFNRREAGDPTGHAEMIAIRQAATHLGDWRLNDCALYVTLEPCSMCAGAIVNARIGRLVFGAFDPKAGAVGSLYNLCEDRRLNHRVAVTPGVCGEASAQLLRRFFRQRRRANRKRSAG